MLKVSACTAVADKAAANAAEIKILFMRPPKEKERSGMDALWRTASAILN
ncbi:hypothetical protein [Novosphingobium sp.]|nr:hypothetical protein [Novosphingobium sp.]